MRQSWLTVNLLSSLMLLGPGCMLMHGDPLGHHFPHTDHPPTRTATRELQTDDLTIILEAPPLVEAQQSSLLVTVKDSNTGQPFPAARVTIAIARDENDSESQELEATETAQTGVYEVKHAFEERGRYILTASISAPERLDSTVTVSLNQTVVHQTSLGTNRLAKPILTFLSALGMALMMGLMVI